MKTHARFCSTTLSLLAVALAAGCSGGGPSGPPASPPPPPASPTIQVLPASYDFGKVTSGNTPAPLEVSIGNTGSASLAVSGIAFGTPSDPGFQLIVNGGAAPCGTTTPTIAAGLRCTVQIAFVPGSVGALAARLEIRSNSAPSPVALDIKGSSEPVAALTVRINQLQSTCGNPAVTAYVSVTDQGGYPVRGLTVNQFSVAQNGAPGTIQSASYVDLAYQPIATAAALDFSNSLTGQPVAFADMKSRVSDYFSAMRTGDQGEVIKFGSEIQVTQAFTTDKAALLTAIAAPFDKGGTTKLYDAALRAVDDTAAVPGDVRRAVILATDGTDNASAPDGLTAAIAAANARSVPLFTVGIGSSISSTVLRRMADETGGLYYEATTSQNLATIYQQLSSILYTNQYVLRFDRATNAATTVEVGATSGALADRDTSALPACN